MYQKNNPDALELIRWGVLEWNGVQGAVSIPDFEQVGLLECSGLSKCHKCLLNHVKRGRWRALQADTTQGGDVESTNLVPTPGVLAGWGRGTAAAPQGTDCGMSN
jgi:hypothetical protein